MRPIRISTASVIECPYPSPEAGVACLRRLTELLGQTLEGRLQGRGEADPDVLSHTVSFSIKDPLLDSATEGEHIVTGSVALRVESINESARTLAVVPRVIVELVRRRPNYQWNWIEGDVDNKLAMILEEVRDAIEEARGQLLPS